MAGLVQRAREDWIDVVRGTAVALVILVHAMQRTELFTGHEFSGLETLTIAVTPLRLPAMFLLSGLFVAQIAREGPSRVCDRQAAPHRLAVSAVVGAADRVLLDPARDHRNRIRVGGDVAHPL